MRFIWSSILRGPIRVHIRRQYVLPGKKMVIKLYSIGIPATLNLALPSLLISALNAILAAYSEVYILVLGIYYKLQTFIYLPANGIVQGMRPLIGYNYGAGESKRVSQIYKVRFVHERYYYGVRDSDMPADPRPVDGAVYPTQKRRSGPGKPPCASSGPVLSSRRFLLHLPAHWRGLGKGTPSLLISLCRYVAVIIPTAFLLSRLFGAVGVWNAFWVTEVITAVISLAIYRRAITGP